MTTEATTKQSDPSQIIKAVSFLVLLGLGAIYFLVVQRNSPPEVSDLMIEVKENSTWSIDIVIKDNDLVSGGSSEEVRIKTLENASNGIIEIDPDIPADLYDDSTVVYLMYTPNYNFYGEDSFTYTATDKRGNEAKATVNLTVLKSNERLARESRERQEAIEIEQEKEAAEAFAIVEAARRKREAEEDYQKVLDTYGDFIDYVSQATTTTPTPTSLLLNEQFNDNSNNWHIIVYPGTLPNASGEIIDGEYFLKAGSTTGNYGVDGLTDLSYKNFIAGFDVTYRNESDEPIRFYFEFGYSDLGRFSVRFSKFRNSRGRTLGPWFSDIYYIRSTGGAKRYTRYQEREISPIADPNKETIRIAVIDQVVIICTETDCNHFGGISAVNGEKIGFSVITGPEGKSYTSSFDNFVVLGLSDDMQSIELRREL